MGNSKRWLKVIVAKKSFSKATSHNKANKDVDDEPHSHEKHSRWNRWMSCSVVDKGSTLAGDEEEEPIQNGAAVLENSSEGAGIVVSDAAREEWAAICIQTAFRGFLARRALRALKGLLRLQSAISRCGVRKQSAGSLRCIQAFVRVQARIRAHRILKARESQGEPQKFTGLTIESQPQEQEADWCDSIGTVEAMQAKVLQRQEAAMKRERAMAYAFSNQWRANSKINSGAFFDYELDNSTWSWIWLDRWISGRHGENNALKKKQDSQTMTLEDSAEKKSSLKKSASLGAKKTANCRISVDASKKTPKPLARTKSQGTGRLQTAEQLQDKNDKSPKKQSAKLNGELSAGQPERRSLSNPKQQPTLEDKRRHSLPNPVKKSANPQGLRSISNTQATNETLESDKKSPEDTSQIQKNQKKAVE